MIILDLKEDMSTFFSRMESTGIEIDDIEVGLRLYENSDEDGVEILDKQVDVYNKYNKEIDRIRSEENRRLRLEKEKIRNREEGKLIELAHTYKGIPYLWGGENPKVGLDCSAYVRDVYRNMGYRLPRVSKDQAKAGKLVSRRELKPGDLLFFDTRSSRNSSDILTPTEEMENAMNMERGFIPNKVSHVGIYLGEGKMLHASSGKGMITEDTLGDYYKIRFLHARRIIE